MLCEASKEINRPTLPSELISAIEEWDAEESLKKRRILKVRPEAITYVCQRSYNPVAESLSNEIECNLELTLKISPYWIDVLSNYQKDSKWKSDSYKEMFYDTYFNPLIDDIPDEWSLKDKEQSHGRGLGKTAQLAAYQYINNMLRNKSCLGVYSSIQQVISSPLNSLNWASIYDELYTECKEHLEAKLPMQPSKKVFELV
jgi:hypothetical protein